MWLFKLVFSKKFMLRATILLAVLVSTFCLTRYFYNKCAWDRWDALEMTATEVYDLDRENRFYEVASELDFFDDPFIKSNLLMRREADEVGMDDVRTIITSKYEDSFPYGEKDIRMWIPGEQFETKKEAATSLLVLLDPFAEDARKVAQALQSRPTTSSSLTRELTLEGLITNEDGRSLMNLLGFIKFYSSRGELYVHMEDSTAAFSDLQRCMELSNVGSHGTSLLAFLVNTALDAGVIDLVSFGMSHHVWSAEQLGAIEEYFVLKKTTEAFREFPSAEFVYSQKVVKLYRKHGYTTVMVKIQGAVEGFFDEIYEAISASEEGEPWVDLEKLIMVAALYVVPEGVMVNNMAIPHRHMLDVFVSAIENDVNIRVLRDLRENVPDLSWHESSGESMLEAYVNQYETLLRAITKQRMAIIACRLEKSYLENGSYPKSLDYLELEVAVNDPFSDGSLIYQTQEDGAYSLHSIGLQQDDLSESSRYRYDPEKERLKFFSDTSL